MQNCAAGVFLYSMLLLCLLEAEFVCFVASLLLCLWLVGSSSPFEPFCVLVSCHVTVVHSGSPFMHVITNRPVGPLRHSAFLPGLRLHFHSLPPITFSPSSPPLSSQPRFPLTQSLLCSPVPALCLSCVPSTPLLDLGGEREEMAHYFKDTEALTPILRLLLLPLLPSSPSAPR